MASAKRWIREVGLEVRLARLMVYEEPRVLLDPEPVAYNIFNSLARATVWVRLCTSSLR